MDIGEQIKAYCEKKEEEKVLKKEIGALSSDIKTYLSSNEDADGISGEWEVKLQQKIVEDLDVDKLVNILMSEYGDKCEYITYAPTINMEALESAIYKGEISEEMLSKIDSCRIKKESVALVYKKRKGGED